MVNVEQCRCARALLGWSAQDLAEKAKIGVATVRRFEGGSPVAANSIEAMADAMIAAGVAFIDDGGKSAGGGPGVRRAAAILAS